jgi:heterodisulfide reductase subunit A
MIVAIGYDIWDPTPASEYGYSKYPNVFTGMEYERMINASGPTGGEMKRRSDGERPHKLAFIQCVGSRNPQLGHAYCCSVCCMFSTKEALLAREHHDDIDSTIYYKDLRAFGKGFYEYVERAKNDYGVRYINSDATVQENPANHNPIVVYDVAGRPEKEEFDMVVLATTLIPRQDAVKISEMLGIPLTEFGFFESKDRILGPMDTVKEGVFLAGFCREPMDIPESVVEGSAAAARAVETVLTKGANA